MTISSSNAEHASVDLAAFLRMTRPELDAVYGKSEPGQIPSGDTLGTAVVGPGSWYERILAWKTRLFFWQGKVFAPTRDRLVNKVSVLSVQAIKAQVYYGKSWLDGKQSIIIDYSKTSLVAKKVRDEVREVAPGLYLGKVYWGLQEDKAKRLVDFILVANPKGKPGPISIPRTAIVLVLLLLAIYFYKRFTSNRPVTYVSDIDHFKYGSTGGETLSGIPYSIWRAMPAAFPQYLPDGPKGFEYEAFGFIYEPGKDLPVGVSKRTVQGVDRVFLTCSVCHTGTVRDRPDAPRRLYVGMPANTVDLEAFETFLFKCGSDEGFTPQKLFASMDEVGVGEDVINKLLLRYYGIGVMKQQLNTLDGIFSFTQRETEFGPGRFDTFNPPKALLGFPMEKVPLAEQVGVCDFPSIWMQNQRQSRGMHLHWDGNNDDVRERDRSAAFGTGAFPPTIDHAAIERTEAYLLDDTRNVSPKYPYPVDATLANRGGGVYAEYCASCHGRSGLDFAGKTVGQVAPIAEIKTDRARLDSYSYELCADQNTLYAGYDQYRFKRFRKTFGYANLPLDGVWLRAPYLHNGSVPTLRDLMEPPDKRPKSFYRGYDVYDAKKVGFVSDIASENGRRFFKYDTQKPDGTPIAGNGNQGHEFGTNLTDDEKDAVVEFLKSF